MPCSKQLHVGFLWVEAATTATKSVIRYNHCFATSLKDGSITRTTLSCNFVCHTLSFTVGAEILGSRIVVEPSHQQRTTKYVLATSDACRTHTNVVCLYCVLRWSWYFLFREFHVCNMYRKKLLSSRIEITDIPMCLTWDVSNWGHVPVLLF